MRKLRMSELNRLSVSEFKEEEKFPFRIALDEVRSLLNVGSVFRTADAFRCEKIYLGGLSPKPSKEMRKTALGATESVNWESLPDGLNSLKTLKEEGYQIWAVEQCEGSVDLRHWEPNLDQKQIFVFGNEVSGVSDEVLDFCDGAIEIPQFGTKHSLNIAVSAGVVLWDYIRRIKA
ncbi:TrmH family RNA methyltransferase [Croceimicrobium sp.]|uniref:TrmH family RNA methyltransferase n=1 Tax=Croceimicrobium sp. TaxID=2828340 RepID=UPI003BA89E00